MADREPSAKFSEVMQAWFDQYEPPSRRITENELGHNGPYPSDQPTGYSSPSPYHAKKIPTRSHR